MGMSNAERQRKWLEKNRALHNFRRRKKKNLPVPVLAEPAGVAEGGSKVINGGEARESTSISDPVAPATPNDSRGGQTSRIGGLGERDASVEGSIPSPPKSKIEELRELIQAEHERVVEEPVKPQVYRNDYGVVISERAWKMLQEKKRRAKEGGYELDEYSQ